MSRPTPDPTRWLTDLMSTEHVLWPNLDITGTSKAVYAATAPWTKAVADITALQMDALKQLTAPWTALMPGAGAGGRADQGPAVRRRGVDQGPAIRGGRADLPGADRPAAQGAGRGAARRAQQGAVELRAAPGDRRAEPGEQPGDQPGGPAAGAWRPVARA